jgi:DNA-binding transcriptional ArsR family regulator
MSEQPEILWDKGTAYDLFTSLWIIHRPDEFGLRPSWAAGVRSRLPIVLRDVLDLSQRFMNVPLNFIHHLPEPKNALTALDVLKSLPAEDRLPALFFSSRTDQETRDFQQLLLSLDGKQRLTAGIESKIKERYANSNRLVRGFTRAMFEAWSNRKEFGETFYDALDAYNKNFFEEEEPRIIPAQIEALGEAQKRAEQMDLITLLEELSEGVRLDWITEVSKVVMAPSFWATPFVIFNRMDDETGIIVFGARPKGTALVPGDLIPEELLNPLKALADPTRLRILRFLQETPATTNELAKLLRLRPPTMIHHLHNLRLAGLVQVTVSPTAERKYTFRKEGLDSTIDAIREFLPGD